MNKTERKAFNWLLTQGYHKEDIVYQARKNPDFLTADSKGFEVKRLYGKKAILFTEKQYNELKGVQDVVVLVFSDESEEPILDFPTSELEAGRITKGVKIHITEENMVKITVEMDLLDEGKKKFPAAAGLNNTALADFLIRKALKSK